MNLKQNDKVVKLNTGKWKRFTRNQGEKISADFRGSDFTGCSCNFRNQISCVS